MASKASRLRAMIGEGKLVVAPGCFNALTGRMVQSLGFPAAFLGGYAVGASLCTTEPLTTLTEMASQASYVAKALSIPLVVDAGAGFGDPIYVSRTVREFESAGVAAIHIEDQVYPKMVSYHKGIEVLVSPEKMAEKIRIATESRDDPDFIIIARTDAIRTNGFEEAIRRAEMYVKAGADMVMMFPNSLDEARMAPKRVPTPLVYLNTEGHGKAKSNDTRPVLSISELQQFGYRMVVYSTSALLASVRAVREMLEHVRNEGTSGLPTSEMQEARGLVEGLLGFEKFYEIEQKTTLKT